MIYTCTCTCIYTTTFVGKNCAKLDFVSKSNTLYLGYSNYFTFFFAIKDYFSTKTDEGKEYREQLIWQPHLSMMVFLYVVYSKTKILLYHHFTSYVQVVILSKIFSMKITYVILAVGVCKCTLKLHAACELFSKVNTVYHVSNISTKSSDFSEVIPECCYFP